MCFLLVGRCEVENELRLCYHNYEFDYWSEINLERARGANDGDRKTKILQHKNNSLSKYLRYSIVKVKVQKVRGD